MALKVTVNQNPDCNLGDKCKTYNVMYINARNTTSSVHIFITASRRFTFPSVLIVHSSLSEANPKIEWEKLDETSGERLSIKNVTQSYALVFYKFRISTTTERSDKMPHLLFLPGLIVQYDVVFNNLTTHFNQSRFSLQLVMISSVALEKTEEFRRHTLSSIDDEPLCFIDDELRTVQNSRNIYLAKHQDNLMTGDISNLSNAFPSAFYADRLRPDSKLSPVGIRMLNISFGSPMDGFYANSKYIVW
ncbi:unnamed protein product [Trichobilharzia regenti]|nr:unnamed protein product [Trichobilharzia regenti]